MNEWNETAHKLLDAAEGLIKSRGYNAFSFKDLQNEVGVKTSTIHYYFATKTDLANAAVSRFFERHKQALLQLEQSPLPADKRLRAIADFFVANSKKGEFCLGGMLTSDLGTLDVGARETLADFFEQFARWVEVTIETGKNAGLFRPQVDAKHAAEVFVASLEGGMLISRVKRDSKYYRTLLDQMIDQLRT